MIKLKGNNGADSKKRN
uniref:Uncharacterized protein n=1 Tax=Rhizophora mucronata TaxID=61149 RepID=A0A2P2J4R2_RHIMU